MTAPQQTSPQQTANAATITRPERSSTRRDRKSPLGWLPWALLGLLAALLALTFLLVNAVDDDGREGAADDQLGQLSSDGSGSGGSSGGSGGAGGSGGSQVDLGALSAKALVGGGAVGAVPAAQLPGAEKLAAAKGAAGTVLFAEGSAQIDAAGQEVLNSTASSLKDAGVRSVAVVGHTDVVAGDPVNDTLSQKRADNVAAALRKLLPGVDITTSAKAADEPVASNGNEQGRQINRRAVITAQG